MKPITKIVLYAGLAIALIGGIVGIYFYTLGQKDLTNTKADFTMPANELFAEYEANEESANTKYRDKIVEVSGKVAQVTLNTDSTLNVMLMDVDDFSGVLCTFNAISDPASIDINKGDNVVIRGICSGMLMDVQLNNCVLVLED